jgi:cytoskeletal protein CcmA (bactofilin family)
VLIGTQTYFSVKKSSKHPNKVYGNIFASNDVEIINTFVQGDVRGRNVKIGKRTEISGKVYFIDTIKIDPKVTLTHEPIQISKITENK